MNISLPEEVFISNNGICLRLVYVEENEREDTCCPEASKVLRHQHLTVQWWGWGLSGQWCQVWSEDSYKAGRVTSHVRGRHHLQLHHHHQSAASEHSSSFPGWMQDPNLLQIIFGKTLRWWFSTKNKQPNYNNNVVEVTLEFRFQIHISADRLLCLKWSL